MGKNRKLKDNMKNNSTELPTIPPESSFQLENNDSKRQLIILQDTHIPQEARDKMYFLLNTNLTASYPSLLQM